MNEKMEPVEPEESYEWRITVALIYRKDGEVKGAFNHQNKAVLDAASIPPDFVAMSMTLAEIGAKTCLEDYRDAVRAADCPKEPR